MVADAPPLSRDVAWLAAFLAASRVTHLVRPEVHEGSVPIRTALRAAGR